MPDPNPPYHPHFSARPASSAAIDRAQAAIGGAAPRAGHTSIDLRAKGALTWQTGTGRSRADGLVPFYFYSVNVYFRLTVYVVRSTLYQAAEPYADDAPMRHKVDEHIINPLRMMYGFRDQVVTALNAVRLPTEDAPQWLRPNQVGAMESGYVRRVSEVIKNHRNRLLPRELSERPSTVSR
jgi:hypothetical protein